MSGEQFGQGSEEDGLRVDMNRVDVGTLDKIKQKAERLRKKQKKYYISLAETPNSVNSENQVSEREHPLMFT